MNAVIDEALNLDYHGAHAQDQSFNITLERDFGQDIAPIEVNPQDMTRVFLNIFSNGFYAATRRGRNVGDAALVSMLKVTTRDIGETVEIRVRGNGTGVPAEIRDKLFQPFFTTKRTGGALATVCRLPATSSRSNMAELSLSMARSMRSPNSLSRCRAECLRTPDTGPAR